MIFSATGLYLALIILLVFSIFFSLTETAMLSVNRYRVRHMVRHNNRSAKLVQGLLERPDRLLGVILLGNTVANIAASAVATLIAIRLLGDHGVWIATVFLTLFILIFAEITPKTISAMYPERIAFVVVWPLVFFSKLVYPFVWLINTFTNSLLALIGIHIHKHTIEHLSHEELRTVLHEAGGRIALDYRAMLIKVLDLEKATVDDIMIPRNEIIGIDITKDWDVILQQLTNSQHTRLPVYEESIEHVIGILHVRKALNLLAEGNLSNETLRSVISEGYFVPEGTPLNIQLLNFRHEKNRIGFVVSEYGDLLGLVTLEDILEEIVGEFTTDMAAMTSRMIHPQLDGSLLVDGSVTIRELNRSLHADFSVEGPKTLSGLIIEYLEMIPTPGTSVRIQDYAMEILNVKGNTIKSVKIMPKKIKPLNHESSDETTIIR